MDEFEPHRLAVLQGSGLLRLAAPPELQDICERAREYFGVAVALVTLIDADRQHFLASVGTELRGTPRAVAFCDHTIRDDGVLVVPDAQRDPRFARNPLVTGEPFVRMYAGAPLIYLDGARLGSFCLIDTQPRDLTEIERCDLALTAERVVGLLLEQHYETRFPGVVS